MIVLSNISMATTITLKNGTYTSIKFTFFLYDNKFKDCIAYLVVIWYHRNIRMSTLFFVFYIVKTIQNTIIIFVQFLIV